MGEHANEATSWLLQQQTQFSSKWTEGEDISENFQAFSISVLHFCGVKSSHRISCTVFHLSELFRCRIMVSIGTFVFCYSACELKIVSIFSFDEEDQKMDSRWVLFTGQIVFVLLILGLCATNESQSCPAAKASGRQQEERERAGGSSKANQPGKNVGS